MSGTAAQCQKIPSHPTRCKNYRRRPKLQRACRRGRCGARGPAHGMPPASGTAVAFPPLAVGNRRLPSATDGPMAPSTATAFSPHLYFVDARLVGPLDAWPAWFERIAGLGFDHVLVGAFNTTGRAGHPRVVADHDRPHEALATRLDTGDALARLVEQAREFGLRLMLDVTVDRIAVEHPLRRGAPDWYIERAHDDARIDPRTAAFEQTLAYADIARPEVGEALAGWWHGRFTTLSATGLAGFLVDAPQRLPAEWWRAWLGSRHGELDDVRWIAGIPGHAREALGAFEGAGFDGVFSSLRWWDLRAPWLLDEHALLRRVASPIAFPDAFDGPRLAHDLRGLPPDAIERGYRRALETAAALGTGWLVPMGFERGVATPLMTAHPQPAAFREAFERAPFDLSEALAEANQLRRDSAVFASRGELAALSGADAAVTVLLRGDSDWLEQADEALLIALNPELDAPGAVDPDCLAGVPGAFTRFAPLSAGRRAKTAALGPLALMPGSVSLLRAARAKPVKPGKEPKDGGKSAEASKNGKPAKGAKDTKDARDEAGRSVQAQADTAPRRRARSAAQEALAAALEADRIAIERVEPSVDDGRFAAKRVVGEAMRVSATLIVDGHARLGAAVAFRAADEADWREVPLAPLGNDRWQASIPLDRIGRHQFRVLAWRNDWGSLVDDIGKKHAAGQEIALELQEARALLAAALKTNPREAEDPRRDTRAAQALAKAFDGSDAGGQLALLLAPASAAAYAALYRRSALTRDSRVHLVEVERRAARFASWYEMFPRSAADDAQRHGTFDDVIAPPAAHPRDGLRRAVFPADPPHRPDRAQGPQQQPARRPRRRRQPLRDRRRRSAAIPSCIRAWARWARFRALVDAGARARPRDRAGLRHPVLARPSLAARAPRLVRLASRRLAALRREPAEEVPGHRQRRFLRKRRDARAVGRAARRGAVLGGRGREDLPRRQPAHQAAAVLGMADRRRARAPSRRDVPLRSLHAAGDDVPARQGRLLAVVHLLHLAREQARAARVPAGAGRRPGARLLPAELLRQHARHQPALPAHAPRAQFLIRAALAALGSGLWGMYSGFELCEAAALPGKEEYLDSEKYQLRPRDYQAPGNIVAEIARLNRIRRDNPALQTHLGIRFLDAPNDSVLVFGKATPGFDNVIVAAISLDPWAPQSTDFMLDAALYEGWGVPEGAALRSVELANGHQHHWHGTRQYVNLDPHALPFAHLAHRARPAAARRLDAAARRRKPSMIREDSLDSPQHAPFQRGADSARRGTRRNGARFSERGTLADDPLWYKDAVIYQVHVKSFFDANNDGIGDFPGLIAKLDYIAELGVDTLWLLPFYPSPRRDDGYDIADYRDVHPDYGTLADVRRFIREAHARGLRVITELVINHTSDQHPWFQRARRAKRGSRASRLLRVVRHRHEVRRHAHHLHRHRAVQLDLGPGRRPVLLAPLLFAPAGPELRQSGGAARGAPGDALLAGHGRRRPAPGRGALPGRTRRHQQREPARDARGAQAHPRRDRRRLPQPHAAGRGQPVARGRAGRTSAARGANATWPSTSR